jgi:hypothetical protein
MRGVGRAFLLATVVATAGASSAAAQTARPAVALSADSVDMGTVFEMRVSVHVPEGSIVYFPDTLAATQNMESAARVRSWAEASPEGGARLTLTYPMIAFGTGTLPVPGFDLLVTRRPAASSGEAIPGGSVVGSWDDAPARAAAGALTRVPRQSVWVAPVLTPRDLMEGVEPMPPSDVLGGDWNWPSLALALLFSSLLVVTLVSTTSRWLGGRVGQVAPDEATLEAKRHRALKQLDDLLAEGIPEGDRLLDFYAKSGFIVRGYVEAMDPLWAPSLTSTELMANLGARWQPDAMGALPSALAAGEAVKFGRRRPGRETAENHWRALRGWVEESGGRAW